MGMQIEAVYTLLFVGGVGLGMLIISATWYVFDRKRAKKEKDAMLHMSSVQLAIPVKSPTKSPAPSNLQTIAQLKTIPQLQITPLSARTLTDVEELPRDSPPQALTPRPTPEFTSRTGSAHVTITEHVTTEPQEASVTSELELKCTTTAVQLCDYRESEIIKSEDSSVGSMLNYINIMLSDTVVDNLTKSERQALLMLIAQRFKLSDEATNAVLNVTGRSEDRTLVPGKNGVVQLFSTNKAN